MLSSMSDLQKYSLAILLFRCKYALLKYIQLLKNTFNKLQTVTTCCFHKKCKSKLQPNPIKIQSLIAKRQSVKVLLNHF